MHLSLTATGRLAIPRACRRDVPARVVARALAVRQTCAMHASAPAVLALSLVALPAYAEPLVLEWPSSGERGGWKIEAFEGETRYRVVELDGRRVVEADSAATASSLYLEQEID